MGQVWARVLGFTEAAGWPGHYPLFSSVLSRQRENINSGACLPFCAQSVSLLPHHLAELWDSFLYIVVALLNLGLFSYAPGYLGPVWARGLRLMEVAGWLGYSEPICTIKVEQQHIPWHQPMPLREVEGQFGLVEGQFLHILVALLNYNFFLCPKTDESVHCPSVLSLPRAACIVQGGNSFITMSLSLLLFSVRSLYPLLCKSSSVSLWFFFRRNCSICRYGPGASMEEVSSESSYTILDHPCQPSLMSLRIRSFNLIHNYFEFFYSFKNKQIFLKDYIAFFIFSKKNILQLKHPTLNHLGFVFSLQIYTSFLDYKITPTKGSV